jgi:hypothetical protein
MLGNSIPDWKVTLGVKEWIVLKVWYKMHETYTPKLGYARKKLEFYTCQ